VALCSSFDILALCSANLLFEQYFPEIACGYYQQSSMNHNNNKDAILSTSSQSAPSAVTPVSNKRPLTDNLTDLRFVFYYFKTH
jgi:hypothetical protein